MVERPTAIQNRYLIACLRISLSWSMGAPGLQSINRGSVGPSVCLSGPPRRSVFGLVRGAGPGFTYFAAGAGAVAGAVAAGAAGAGAAVAAGAAGAAALGTAF